MSDGTTTKLGRYIAGEIPEPWVHQFLDAAGNVVNLTGYTVRVTYRLNFGSQIVRNGTLADAPTGKAQYTWVAADIATAGVLRGELTVGNGSNRYARHFVMTIDPTTGGTLPAI